MNKTGWSFYMHNKMEINETVSLMPPEEVERVVVMERLYRYNHGAPCNAVALHRHLRDQRITHPLPSVRRIAHILTKYGLTYGRTGWYPGEELDWLPASARIPENERR